MHQALDLPSHISLQLERHRMHEVHVLLLVLQQGGREALYPTQLFQNTRETQHQTSQTEIGKYRH